MGQFLITGPDGKKYKVTGDSAEGAVAALKKMLGGSSDSAPDADAQAMRDRIAAAKAGTLKVSPEREARQAEIDQRTAANMEDPSAIESFGGKLLPGMTFGFADEIAAGVGSLFEDRSYGQILQGLRDREARLAEANPVAAALGEVTGAVAAPGAMGAKAVSAAPSLVGKAATGAATGALGGGVYGFGTGEGGFDERASSATSGAIGGAVIGAAVPAVGALGRAALDKLAHAKSVRAAIAAAKTPADLKAAADALYAQADQAVGMPRADFATATGGMISEATRKGLDADLTPGAAKVASRLDDAANASDPAIGFKELDILRRKAAVPAGNIANRTEQSIGTQIIDGIDQFVDSVDPALADVVREARDTWAMLRRSDVVEKAMEKAKNTASGFENGLRIEFRKILNNPKLLRGFNADEVKAIKKVVQGSTFGNLIRQVGKLGLGISGQSNSLMATIGGIAGTAASGGNPLGGLAVVAGGTAAKALAERETRKAAETVLKTVLARDALSAIPVTTYLPGAERAVDLLGYSGLPQASSILGEYLLGR